MASSLRTYRRKRDFRRTAEPRGRKPDKPGRGFVVHEHHASRLHFDLRLEMDGVLKSWAVPRGPSLDPGEKRLAVRTEDHPVQYLRFEGRIEEGQYGAGEMVIWDEGTYGVPDGIDPAQAVEKGKLHFTLQGKRLRGEFVLVRSRDGKNWLLFKKNDADAAPGWTLRPLLEYGSRRDGARAAEGPHPMPPGAARAALPAYVEPMKAKLADAPFSHPGWIFEPKWDGWRALLRIRQGEANLVSRNRIALDAYFPELKGLPAQVRSGSCLLDGEVVALDDRGVPRFQLLQSRLKRRGAGDARGQLVYFAFDLIHCDGYRLSDCALEDRKALLERIIVPSPRIRYSTHLEEKGELLFSRLTRLGFEGVMAKRRDSPYRRGRSSEWLKFKSRLRQEVVIAGYTRPRGSRAGFGALIAGLYEDGKLRFAGHVGGGFDRKSLEVVRELLEPLRTPGSPFAAVPATNEPVQWVKPLRVAEVEFAEWTRDGLLRMPIFMALRPDKDPRECVREVAAPAAELLAEADRDKPARERRRRTAHRSGGGRGAAPMPSPAGLELTNLDKVYWPGEGHTKGDLIEYYRRIAPHILPHVQDRPLILKRYPNGIKAKPFYQHEVKGGPPFLTLRPIAEKDGSTVRYAFAQNVESLLYLANLGTIAVNPWLSRYASLDRPDWAVLDLDPQEVDFQAVVESARFLKTVLDDLAIKAFVKTSGSRGMHVYLPLKAAYTFEQGMEFSQLLAHYAVSLKPDFFTVERSLKARPRDRIYLDCMQNSYGKSVAAAYSVRERPGACVSAPLEWKELTPGLRMEDFNLENMPARLERRGDLFQGVFKEKNTLAKPLRRLERRLGTV